MMPHTIEFNRGDVVLVSFIFANETGVKRRPAVILSSQTYHAGRGDVMIAGITSRTSRILRGDHLITDWQGAGLLFLSVATSIIRTIKPDMVNKKLGSLSAEDASGIDYGSKLALELF
jgi:mRNA interferase MazF